MRQLLVVGFLLLGATVAPAEPALELPLPVALRPSNAGMRSRSAVEQEACWLSAHQSRDGSWDAAGFDRWCHRLRVVRDERLPGLGEARHDVTVTSLALCAYLGAGYTHRGRHPFASTVGKGLRWLKAQQAEDGRIGPSGDLRAHALATLALTEAYGMTESPLWLGSARRALVHLMSIPPDGDDDLATYLTVLPLRSLVLIEEDAARRKRESHFGLDTDAALRRLRAWVDARPEEPSLVLRAANLLARIFLGADPREDGDVKAEAARLAKFPPALDDASPAGDLTYIWLGTLAMFQVGGLHWKTWNEHLKRAVVDTQRKDGSFCETKGSWDPRGRWIRSLGRVGASAMATMSLEVYYRYDKVFGSRSTGACTPMYVQPGTWRRSALPPHAARFEDPDGRVLPIETARLAAEVHGVRARVVMDLWVRNPDGRPREGRLRIRLPDGASPYYLAFGTSKWEQAAPFAAVAAVKTDLPDLLARQEGKWGSVREARMAPTGRARRAYETIVSRRKDPALLTWAGNGVFDLGVFPLFPKKLHRVVLGYEVDLTPVGDDHELRLDLPEGVPDVAAALKVRGSDARTTPETPVVKGVRRWSGSRSIRVLVSAPRDVVLAGDGHFAAWIRPVVETPSAANEPSRAVFLLDASAGGRDEHFPVRLRLLEAVLERNRGTMKEFAVAAFDTEVRWWREGFVENTPENVQALMAFARALEPDGATDLERTLTEACTLEGEYDLFLLGDGTSTWGETDLNDVVSGRRVFTFRTGLSGESLPVLEALAEDTGGALINVLGESDVEAASVAHRHGAWRIESLHVPGVTDLFAAGEPTTLHLGQQLRLVGRGTPDPDAALVLGLARGAERTTLRVPLPAAIESDMAARAYGHAAVVALEARGDVRRGLALAYASHFRVVRETAALVMLETEKDYERFGLTRLDYGPQILATPVASVLSRPAPAVDEPTWTGVPLSLDEEGGRPLSRELARRLDDEPGSVEALLALALDAWDAGLRKRAYVTLRARAARHPDVTRLHWLLARMAESLDLHDEALRWFEAALDRRCAYDLAWVVASDYARFLRHVEAGRRTLTRLDFALARVRSLEGFEFTTEADRVILLVGSAPDLDPELLIAGMPVFGRGPRMFVEPKGTSEVYDVEVVLPEGKRKGPQGPLVAQLIDVRDWGRPTESVVVRNVVLRPK